MSSANTRAHITQEMQSRHVGGKSLNIALGLTAVMAIAFIVLWGVQLDGGLIQTGMRNLDSWGLYLISFMFFVGLSAGGLIISSVPNAFGVEGFGGISKVAIWSSICCTVMAAALIIVDLGNPLRVWELLAYSNLTSPLMWDVIVISTYLVLSVAYLIVTVRHEQGKVGHAAHRVLSVVALIVAVMVHSVTAWIWAVPNAHEFWHTALLAPWFVSSALVCGTSLVLIIVVAMRKTGYLAVDQRHIVRLAKFLGVFVCVDLYFFGCDLLVSGYPGGNGGEIVALLTTGVLAPFFWTEVIGCALCAVICFVPALRRNGLIVLGSVLAIIGIFCKRVQLMVGGWQQPNIDYASLVTEYSATNSAGTMADAFSGIVYWPTGLEFAIVACGLGFCGFLFLLGIKFLPLKPVALAGSADEDPADEA